MADRRAPPTSTYLTGHPSRQARWMSSSVSWFAPQARSLGRHAEAAVEPDGLAVEVGVLGDRLHQRRVLLRRTEALGEEHARAEGLALVLGEEAKQGRVHQAWGDGVDADADRRQVTRCRQGEP